MEAVELEQKKALLVDFANGTPIGSTLTDVQKNTAETVSILKSFQKKGGLTQHSSLVETSPSSRVAEPARPQTLEPKIKVPAPVIVEKVKEELRIEKKPILTKPIPDKSRDKKSQETLVKSAVTVQKEEKPKEDLSKKREERGIWKSILNTLKKQKDEKKEDDDDDIKKESRLSKALDDKEDVKEAGMLGIFGPIAPAIQETMALVKRDKDDDEKGTLSKLFGRFKKDKEGTKAETVKGKKDKSGRLRDSKGRFIPSGKTLPIVKRESEVIQKTKGRLVRPIKAKTPVSKKESEVVEKLAVIHDDLITNNDDQEKRDKKLRRAVGNIEGGDDDMSIKSILKNPSKLLKGGLAVAAVAAVSGGVAMIGKDIYDMFKSFTEKDKEGKQKGLANIKEEDIAGVAGGVGAGVIGATIGTLILPGLGTAIGAGLGMIIGNIMGEKIATMKVEDYGGPYGIKPQEKSELGTGPYGIKAKEKAELVTGPYGIKPQEKSELGTGPYGIKAKEKALEDTWMKKQTVQESRKPLAIEESKSKRIQADQTNKSQKQVDLTNKELVSKTDETNKLLKEMIKTQKENGQTIIKDERIPDGIDNLQDQLSIRGL